MQPEGHYDEKFFTAFEDIRWVRDKKLLIHHSVHLQTCRHVSAFISAGAHSRVISEVKLQLNFFYLWFWLMLTALTNSLLPVTTNLNQSHKFKKFSRSLTSKITLWTLKFVTTDCRHIRLALWGIGNNSNFYRNSKCILKGTPQEHIMFSETPGVTTQCQHIILKWQVTCYHNNVGYSIFRQSRANLCTSINRHS